MLDQGDAMVTPLDPAGEAMMPIAMRCRCGKDIRVPDDAAGRKVRCQACGGLSTVPMDLDGGAEVVDTGAPAPRPRPAYPDPPAVAQAHAGAATGPFATWRPRARRRARPESESRR